MKKCLLLCLLPMMLSAEIVRKPDTNTLWAENTKPLKFSAKGINGWRVRNGEIKQLENGFEFNSIGKNGDIGMYVPASKEFPYLEFDVEFLERGDKFMMFNWMVNQGPRFHWSRHSENGYYVQNIYDNAPKIPQNGNVFCSFSIRDARVRIKNLRMVKTPRIQVSLDNNFFATRKCLCEDALLNATVKSSLKPVSAVSLGFIDSVRGNPLQLNEQDAWELKPVAGNSGEYNAEVEVRSLAPRNYEANYIMVSVNGYDTKAFTWFNQPWKSGAAFNSDRPLSSKTDWINNLRTDHPRIFINRETLPLVKAWAQQIGTKQLLADAENFQIDPNLKEKRRGAIGTTRPYASREVEIAALYEDEALTCALAYLLTDDKKYAGKTWKFLDHNLAVYKDCAEKRASISWFAIRRIENMAALDWIWNTDVPRAKKYLKEFIDVNIKYARHGWWGPFFGVNDGSGKVSGFYGDANNELFMGVMAYKEGICDDLAISMLKEGYKKYRECLNYRDTIAEDDGMLSSPTINYSAGQYPWASYDFLYLWRTAFKKPVKLPFLTHLMYFPEWFQWNSIPGKGKVQIRNYGFGDNDHSTMAMFGISSHLYAILGVYGAQYPTDSAQIAAALQRMDGKYQADYFKDPRRIPVRKKAPPYYYGFFRRYLAYDMKNVKPPVQTAGKKKAMARHFRPGGVVFMHSGTGKNDTRALFVSGCTVAAHNNRGDENHFTIFKNGYLAIDSGYRMDSWYGAWKYHNASIAHNTILIHDPSERFVEDIDQCENTYKRGSFMWDAAEREALYKVHKSHFADADGGQDKNIGGKCRAFSTNSFYSYALGDATRVYSAKKCKEFTRQFIHIQPDVFIVFDRVESTDPTFKKEWLLHFLEEPEVNGNLTTAKVSDEGGVLRCTTLLPENGVVTKIGGPGKEFMGEKVNWNGPAKIFKNLQYVGAWRINLAPKTPAKRDYFLNVIDVGEKPVEGIKMTQNAATATVTFTTPQGRTVTVVFNKTGNPGGRITIKENGKVLCDEPLTQAVQAHKGFLY